MTPADSDLSAWGHFEWAVVDLKNGMSIKLLPKHQINRFAYSNPTVSLFAHSLRLVGNSATRLMLSFYHYLHHNIAAFSCHIFSARCKEMVSMKIHWNCGAANKIEPCSGDQFSKYFPLFSLPHFVLVLVNQYEAERGRFLIVACPIRNVGARTISDYKIL